MQALAVVKATELRAGSALETGRHGMCIGWSSNGPVRVPRQIPDPGWIDENMDGVQGDLETKPTATVLVVDDEPAIREIVAALLEEEGYLVRHAKDGLEALTTIDDDCIRRGHARSRWRFLGPQAAAPGPSHAGGSDERGLHGRRSAGGALRAQTLRNRPPPWHRRLRARVNVTVPLSRTEINMLVVFGGVQKPITNPRLPSSPTLVVPVPPRSGEKGRGEGRIL